MWKSVSRCQWLSWTVFGEVHWLCQTTLILLNLGWMEVRLSANQNVSLMVFRDEVYSDTPLITAVPGCALQTYSSHTHWRLFTSSRHSFRMTRVRNENPKVWLALARPLLGWKIVSYVQLSIWCRKYYFLIHWCWCRSYVSQPITASWWKQVL